MYSEERTKEKAINESGIDTDWFLADSNGKIAVVCSILFWRREESK